jgi:hypothetical protein
MAAGKMKSYTTIYRENQARHVRVTSYFQVLKHLALTTDQEEQKLAKRRVLQICLELQDMKDCMKEGAMNILSRQEIEQLDNQQYHDTDPSVRFFGLEWRSVSKICEEIYQDMTSFWTQLEEENTVNTIQLVRSLSALNKLEYDVSNHAVALHEKKHSSESVHVEEKQKLRRKSCHHYNKAKHEKIGSRQTSLGWMGRGSKDKEEDSGIEISYTESNELEDMKSTENAQTSVTNHGENNSRRMTKKSFTKKKSRISIIDNITFLVKSRLKVDQ